MEQRLGEAERLATVGRLAAGVAHEVRNPLNAMLLTMQQLSDKTAPPAGTPERERFDRYAHMVVSELARLERLVGTFLDLSRPGATAHEEVDVGDSVRAAVELFASQAEERGVSLAVDVEGPVVVDGDPERLPTVWNNLVSNALHATPPGGKIVARARATGEGAVVEVVDDGQGIEPEKLPHVWEPFFSGRADGTGLGLSLVRSIVEAHGGRAEAESVPGSGTTIRVHLPGRGRAKEST